MTWQEIVWEILRLFGVVATFIYNMVLVSYNFVVQQQGAAAGFLFLIVMFVVIPFLVGFFSISRVQQKVESLQAFLAKLFIKLILIGLLTFTMMFLMARQINQRQPDFSTEKDVGDQENSREISSCFGLH